LDEVSLYDKIVIRNFKKRSHGYQTNVYMNFHLKDDLQMELLVYFGKMMQEGELTSFELYNQYHTNRTHE